MSTPIANKIREYRTHTIWLLSIGSASIPVFDDGFHNKDIAVLVVFVCVQLFLRGLLTVLPGALEGHAGYIRIAILCSVVWLVSFAIGLNVIEDTYNIDVFFLFGALPVFALWGLAWVSKGFIKEPQ